MKNMWTAVFFFVRLKKQKAEGPSHKHHSTVLCVCCDTILNLSILKVYNQMKRIKNEIVPCNLIHVLLSLCTK